MKKTTAVLSVLFCTAIQLVAHAGNLDPGGFASIGVGASDYSTTGKNSAPNKAFKFKITPMYGMELGYKFNKYLRAAFNPQYRMIKFSDPNNANAPNANINAINLGAMLNIYLDLYNYSNFTPYVVAGAGISTFSFKIKKPSIYQKPSSSVTMNLSAGVGIQAALSHNMGVDLSGRYAQLGSIKLQQIDASGNPIPPLAQKQKVHAKDVMLSLYMML